MRDTRHAACVMCTQTGVYVSVCDVHTRAFEGDNKEEEEEAEEVEGINRATRREYQAAFRRHRDPRRVTRHTPLRDGAQAPEFRKYFRNAVCRVSLCASGYRNIRLNYGSQPGEACDSLCRA